MYEAKAVTYRVGPERGQQLGRSAMAVHARHCVTGSSS